MSTKSGQPHLASVLSFMVGYDPSRFDGLFELASLDLTKKREGDAA
ncbi:MAG TPA: hypothetical protein VL049_13850 [Candidatus Dormibacteraeota bacterium]|nr:hypothetical protein [Candidatus Dormibacteraeota bacterium]